MKKTVLILLTLSAVLVASAVAVFSGTSNTRLVTFNKDVAPILYKNCAVCHRPNDIAPMSLLSYKEARPWARSIKEKMLAREMPPWSPDPAYGEFTNDHRLAQKDVDTVVAWVDQGAKEGNAKDLPGTPEFVAGGWEIGKRSLAYENLCYVVSANQGLFLGSDFPTDRMRGRSQIIDFAGRVVNIAETTGECILQADIQIEQLRQKRAQVQMNFLNELQTHVHAVQYARKALWPKELWKDGATGGDIGNIKAARENIARLQREGLFVAPASGLDKKSFV